MSKTKSYFKNFSSKLLAKAATKPIFSVLAVLAILLTVSNLSVLPIAKLTAAYPELNDLKGKELSFDKLSHYFEDLADKKGAPYALEVLSVAPVPPGTDMHLLGHVVGDKLYKQQGAKGIRVCTEDFRNACSHSIVVGLFADKGEGALEEINQACRQAPGGSGAYSMCFHGLGHGILSSNGYQMEKSIELCKKTSSAVQPLGIEAVQCISGTVMEIISGGGHDRETWLKQNKKYLVADQPLGLCQADFIPSDAKPICYLYLTPQLFIAAGGNLADPRPYFQKAFTFCEEISINESANRDSCFGGFGKEFVVLAQNRDIRRVDQMNDGQLRIIYDWCRLAQVKDGVVSCISHSLGSLYWGGENDVKASIRFCRTIDDSEHRNHCFANLNGMVFHFQKNPNKLQEFCSNLPQPYLGDCNDRLRLSLTVPQR